MSTLFYGDDRLAMYVDNVHRTDRVTADRIVNEAASWGLSKSRAAEVVADILERSPAAIAAAQGETDGLPAEIPVLVGAQLARLRRTFDSA
ncbi:MAG TPA: hypothetical protein VNC61_05600 [Acidimicrobiales bacterium]|nr:hypothetical protein [Acidimicrobiales bacterium]